MTPRDWLLLLLALDNTEPRDPVRLQKGMFLLAEESGVDPGERYACRAYDYGPFSSQIYDDIELLVAHGLVEVQPAPGYRWSRYMITPEGLDNARASVEGMDEHTLPIARWLAETKRSVLSMSFADLLSYVYERHPAYVVNSVFST